MPPRINPFRPPVQSSSDHSSDEESPSPPRVTARESDLLAQVQSLGTTITSKDSRISQLQLDVAEKDTQILTLDTSLSAKDGQINSLSFQLQAHSTKIKTLEADVATKSAQITLFHGLVNSHGSPETLSASLATAQQTILRLLREAETAASKVAALEESKKAAVTKEARLREELGTLRTANEEVGGLQGDLDTAKKRIEELENAPVDPLQSVWYDLREGQRTGSSTLNEATAKWLKKNVLGAEEKPQDIINQYIFHDASVRSWHIPSEDVNALELEDLAAMCWVSSSKGTAKRALDFITSRLPNLSPLISPSSLRLRLNIARLKIKLSLPNAHHYLSYNADAVDAYMAAELLASRSRLGYFHAIVTKNIITECRKLLGFMGKTSKPLRWFPKGGYEFVWGEDEKSVKKQIDARRFQGWVKLEDDRFLGKDEVVSSHESILRLLRKPGAPKSPNRTLSLLALLLSEEPSLSLVPLLQHIIPTDLLNKPLMRTVLASFLSNNWIDSETVGWLAVDDVPMDTAGWRVLLVKWAVKNWGAVMEGLADPARVVNGREEVEDPDMWAA